MNDVCMLRVSRKSYVAAVNGLHVWFSSFQKPVKLSPHHVFHINAHEPADRLSSGGAPASVLAPSCHLVFVFFLLVLCGAA